MRDGDGQLSQRKLPTRQNFVKALARTLERCLMGGAPGIEVERPPPGRLMDLLGKGALGGGDGLQCAVDRQP
jgi:hypothetical protein